MSLFSKGFWKVNNPNWVCFSDAGFPDWLGCYFIMMLGSDRVFQDLGSDAVELRRRAGWRRRIDVLVLLFRCVWEQVIITVRSDVFIVYSDDCKYINYSDFFCKNLLSIIYCSAAMWDCCVFCSSTSFFSSTLSSSSLAFGILGVENFGSWQIFLALIYIPCFL